MFPWGFTENKKFAPLGFVMSMQNCSASWFQKFAITNWTMTPVTPAVLALFPRLKSQIQKHTDFESTLFKLLLRFAAPGDLCNVQLNWFLLVNS